MPRTAHRHWRCTECESTRDTAPVLEAFCTNSACPEQYGAMEPWEPDEVRADFTATMLAFPDLTPDQRRTEAMMRENRGVRAC